MSWWITGLSRNLKDQPKPFSLDVKGEQEDVHLELIEMQATNVKAH